MRQVGYLQRLYRDARSTEHKILLLYIFLHLQHVNRIPRNRLPRVMKRYSPTGRRNRGRPSKSFWIRVAQVAQLRDRYMMVMMMMVNKGTHTYVWS